MISILPKARHILPLLFLPLLTQAQMTDDSLARRVILIGDAGELHKDGHNPVIDAVKQRINLQDARNTVLFLGDNIYPLGLPDAGSSRYEEARQILDYQVGLVKNTNTQAIFIPGNHDWKRSKPDGWQTVINQQLYVDSLQLPNVNFLPKDGCPGPEEVHLDNNTTLIIMDTEWWLFPYQKPGSESSCDTKTREEVLAELNDIVSRNRNKLIIFAAHHPFRSYGIHGGYYTIKQHIFPFTDLKKGLYIPLPLVGSIYPITRGVFGTPEDIPNPIYQSMIRGVEAAIKPHGPAIFVSGHDHTLQLIKDDQNFYIVSGSGSKENRVKKGSKSLFASNENGYTVLEISKSGRVEVKYYTIEKTDAPVYAQQLFSLQDIRSNAIANANLSASQLPATVRMPADSQYTDKTGFHYWLMGRNYRDVWATPLNYRVLDLNKEKGGLKILKRGGGMQTLSLRLEDRDGKEWVLRSLKKYPEKAIPEALRETVAREVVQDQISAANPYAPLAVVPLADAAGVHHTNPSFVYLPKDTVLGIYQSTFGDDVYLFEEREADIKGKTLSTLKVLEQLQGDNDNTIDQPAVLNARLLDLLMADWDRHDDQWRWAAENSKKAKTQKYFPIPRDRDQAFFVNEGLLPRIASRRWAMPNIQGFRPKIRYIEGQNPTAQPFDRSFMNELSEQQWKDITHNFVQHITDSAIKAAVNNFPDTIRAEVGERTYNTLKARRDILEKEALVLYRFLSKHVEVTGSKKDELFTIERLPGGLMDVTVTKINKKGELEQVIYHRTFDPKDTREIRLFGLGGEDRYVTKGDNGSPIKVRIIGGKDIDTYIDSTGSHAGKRIRIYELANRKDSFDMHGNDRRILSSNPEIIRYERTFFRLNYNKLMPLASAGFNADDGLSLGLGFQYTTQGFRKRPFATRQTVLAGHSLGTDAWQFRYLGEFTDVIGNTDLTITASAKAPNNTINFFGFGNETVFDKSRTIRYYRTRFALFNIEPLLNTKLSRNVELYYGPSLTYYSLDKDETGGRIISDFPHNGLDSLSVYQSKSYAGLRLGLKIDTRDNALIPTRGISWNTSVYGSQGLNEQKHNYLQAQTDLSIYTNFHVPTSVVLVTRFGANKIWGDYEYFQAAMIGGVQNLRGYRNYRFSGNAAVYNNVELRIKLFDFRSYLFPASVGLLAFNDVGRVWYSSQKSSIWHDGYGGGVYFTPANLVMLSAIVGRSDEGVLPYITFGFRF
ncbi:BamA/TamA family outer membrane protein [Chitinophaga ginsengisoli]|uniref:Calcineurin-like phosphoesterase family protein n=1 Tax=Chitinophaga ginsengisoli TaxID=363837 RepID=A0A2P8FCW6_9BACT|nr:BamA/TamA family outer membrane protein [Chitinophaga ginsengisoli]PSL19547.1 calcineurin-like phosphoesterase family protein [Chitinophaga ginsengisoli]